jgi:hypothetical protein
MRKSCKKWINFREISRNFAEKTIFVSDKISVFAKIFAKVFAKVFAKAKNLTEFDSDTACMVYSMLFHYYTYIALHFGWIK